MSDELITPELVERLKAADVRYRIINVGIAIDEELQNSALLRMVIDAAEEDASVALEQLADVDPTDIKAISHLQARIFRDRFIKKTLRRVQEKAVSCYDSLTEEEKLKGEMEQDNGQG